MCTLFERIIFQTGSNGMITGITIAILVQVNNFQDREPEPGVVTVLCTCLFERRALAYLIILPVVKGVLG